MPTARDVRICFAGDSYVAGTGDPACLGWVGRVSAAAFAEGRRLTSYNLGVRGETSSQVAERLEAELAPRLSAGDERRLVLAFGVNDTVRVDGHVRQSLAQSARALHRALDVAGRATTLVVGPPAVDDEAQNARLHGLGDAFAEVCADRGIPYVDTFDATATDATWRREVREGDGFHPGAAGYAALAAVVQRPFLASLAST
ncbi:GDSL-type esterase/lipase family protein [Isoptericola sp. F-RaC21]|uniref:GDSL-type esterase/lipase family protein n=1 Tax=Isoptericola sp. F-RaC21 TaxID=3141452 RepID=UPI00315B6759